MIPENEIIEGNKIIANFLNLSFEPADKMRYNTSWDWQIPAWSKVIQLISPIASQLEEDELYHSLLEDYQEAIFLNDIQLGHKVLIEAIKWCNQRIK